MDAGTTGLAISRSGAARLRRSGPAEYRRLGRGHPTAATGEAVVHRPRLVELRGVAGWGTGPGCLRLRRTELWAPGAESSGSEPARPEYTHSELCGPELCGPDVRDTALPTAHRARRA